MQTDEYHQLTDIAENLKGEYEKKREEKQKKWADSPFEWTLHLNSSPKGRFGKKISFCFSGKERFFRVRRGWRGGG